MAITLNPRELRELNAQLTPKEVPVELGRIQGYVEDKITGAKVLDAAIYVDGIYHMHNWADGSYRTDYISFGPHTITVKADNYEMGEFQVDLQQELMNLDLLLEPLPVAPTPWSENVTVEDMWVEPPLAYLGETVNIKCYIQYWHPAPLPATIHGTVLVDGVELTASREINIRNPVVVFPYTPTRLGEFTAKSQDKSASFTVAKSVPATYYSPWGGIRMPNPVKWYADDEVYEFSSWDWGFLTAKTDGYADWEPAGSQVTLWSAHHSRTYWPVSKHIVRVVPLEWTDCPEYWDSKKELAVTLSRGRVRSLIYHETYDASRNLAFRIMPIIWKTEGAYGMYRLILECPRCSYEERGPMLEHGHEGLSIMRAMLEHIEQAHPEHPLTQRAW